MEFVLSSVVKALYLSFSMFWEVLWPLILGFWLSATVQAIVPRKGLKQSLGGTSARHISKAAFFGAISSSCSYAAVALARSLYRKGASFISAMVFEIASTNLVIELGIVLIILMGWRFAAAEFFGGIVMIVFLSLLVRFSLSKRLEKDALVQANKGVVGKMEGHAGMDMSVTEVTLLARLFSRKGFTAISHYYVMDWMSVLSDILLGFLIAGALAAWVPNSFWQAFFISNNPKLAFLWGPLIGPIVSIVSFVCSVGNIPLAAVLWQGGISFGGVISFIYADLIVLPILNIYRKYYGTKMMLYIFVVFYTTMVFAGYVTEIVFNALDIIPANRNIVVPLSGIEWNYTTILNIFFILLTVIMVWRFYKTGGKHMLEEMK